MHYQTVQKLAKQKTNYKILREIYKGERRNED
jgi:hypothetical protein